MTAPGLRPRVARHSNHDIIIGRRKADTATERAATCAMHSCRHSERIGWLSKEEFFCAPKM